MEKIIDRSISSLGGSYSPNVNGIVITAMAATLGGTVEVLAGVSLPAAAIAKEGFPMVL